MISFYDEASSDGDIAMTVCIAAISLNVVVLVSDRMITAGDIQFEPPSPKIQFLTSAIAVMASGDSAFHAEIMNALSKDVSERIEKDASLWWTVKEIVDLYVKYRNVAKLDRSESTVLLPLGLDRNTWLEHQKTMNSDLVNTIAKDLINFEIPDVYVIIAGNDMMNNMVTPHIYSIHNDYVSCDDAIGFRAVGSGSRHAESQFMLAKHAGTAGLHMTATLAYRAKKDAEVAPGVGKFTDMYMIGPNLGNYTPVRPEVQEKMEQEYNNMMKKYASIQDELTREVTKYVESISPTNAPSQANKPDTNEIREASATSGPGQS